VDGIRTGVRFLDHMLDTLARTSGLAIGVDAHGDLRHHVIEDVAITLGEALCRLDRTHIVRYADRTIAMDDALVQAVVDVGGRPYWRGRLPSSLYTHWMRSFADHARLTLHVRVLRGHDRHHVVEAAFKALGFALRDALAPATSESSAKGVVRLEASC
jgi:imidazoleglycerol-phosphate dehydratase